MVKVFITMGVVVLVTFITFCLLVAAIGGTNKVDEISSGIWYWPLNVCKVIGNIVACFVITFVLYVIVYLLIWGL